MTDMQLRPREEISRGSPSRNSDIFVVVLLIKNILCATVHIYL